MEDLNSIINRLKKIEFFLNAKFGDLTLNTMAIKDTLVTMITESIFSIGKTYYTDITLNEGATNETDFMLHATGKDNGKLSRDNSQSTENTVIVTQHNPRPKNTDNSSFYYGYRPPAFQTLSGISITSGTNTLTDPKAKWATNELAGASIILIDSTKAHRETKQIVSNTATVITVDSNFTFTDANSSYITLIPVYLGAAQYPWRRGYFAEENGKSIRLGRGTSGGTGIVWICSGTGSPEGVVTAQPGSIYLNYSGGAGTSLYIKESGTGNTGWIAMKTDVVGLAGTKVYYVSDTSGGAVTRKLTFTNGILTSET